VITIDGCEVAKFVPLINFDERFDSDDTEFWLALCIDRSGIRSTRITHDGSYMDALFSSSHETHDGLDIPGSVFPMSGQGWPDEWE
jgi:hypothetical protein